MQKKKKKNFFRFFTCISMKSKVQNSSVTATNFSFHPVRNRAASQQSKPENWTAAGSGIVCRNTRDNSRVHTYVNLELFGRNRCIVLHQDVPVECPIRVENKLSAVSPVSHPTKTVRCTARGTLIWGGRRKGKWRGRHSELKCDNNSPIGLWQTSSGDLGEARAPPWIIEITCNSISLVKRGRTK